MHPAFDHLGRQVVQGAAEGGSPKNEGGSGWHASVSIIPTAAKIINSYTNMDYTLFLGQIWCYKVGTVLSPHF